MAANAGTSVCLRKVDPALIFGLIKEHQVTHMCGAPIVYGMMINAPAALKEGIEHQVNGLIAGAAPPAAIIEGAEQMGFNITHVYGLTETYGPASVCAKHPEWDTLPIDLRAARNGRQGVRYHMQEAIAVMDTVSMEPVPWDGETMGEIMFRGNLVMKGYLKNPKATAEAFEGGWFHTGDLAVVHSDGYIKIKDRSKDVIISGGENISSLEVEDVLYRHPSVIAAAVVAKPDEKWGEVPAAFIELKDGVQNHRSRDHRALPRPSGPFQGAEAGGVWRIAQDVDRENPEVRPAPARQLRARHRVIRIPLLPLLGVQGASCPEKGIPK